MQAYQENPAKIIRDGVIQRFEFTCELAWIALLNARNQTSHIYDDHTAAVIAAKIQNAYLPELQKLAARWEK